MTGLVLSCAKIYFCITFVKSCLSWLATCSWGDLQVNMKINNSSTSAAGPCMYIHVSRSSRHRSMRPEKSFDRSDLAPQATHKGSQCTFSASCLHTCSLLISACFVESWRCNGRAIGASSPGLQPPGSLSAHLAESLRSHGDSAVAFGV